MKDIVKTAIPIGLGALAVYLLFKAKEAEAAQVSNEQPQKLPVQNVIRKTTSFSPEDILSSIENGKINYRYKGGEVNLTLPHKVTDEINSLVSKFPALRQWQYIAEPYKNNNVYVVK